MRDQRRRRNPLLRKHRRGSRLWKGKQSASRQGMPSHALADGSTAGGPNGISFQGTAYITLGLGGGIAYEEALGSDFLGTLIHMPTSGKWKVVADVALHEFEENPAGGPIDSNPYGVLAEPDGRLVVDAGANALLSVAANGTIETLAVFPPIPNPTPVGPRMIEPVPTAVARGPDGALYVGQLTGVPFAQGLANIYRWCRARTRWSIAPDSKRSSALLSGPGGIYTSSSTRPADSSSRPKPASCRASLRTARESRYSKGSIVRRRSPWAATERST